MVIFARRPLSLCSLLFLLLTAGYADRNQRYGTLEAVSRDDPKPRSLPNARLSDMVGGEEGEKQRGRNEKREEKHHSKKSNPDETEITSKNLFNDGSGGEGSSAGSPTDTSTAADTDTGSGSPLDSTCIPEAAIQTFSESIDSLSNSVDQSTAILSDILGTISVLASSISELVTALAGLTATTEATAAPIISLLSVILGFLVALLGERLLEFLWRIFWPRDTRI